MAAYKGSMPKRYSGRRLPPEELRRMTHVAITKVLAQRVQAAEPDAGLLLDAVEAAGAAMHKEAQGLTTLEVATKEAHAQVSKARVATVNCELIRCRG